MIRRIIPLGFDSFGVRSMATYVETDDVKVVLDPGVSLAPLRYGLEPHYLELQRMDEVWSDIKNYSSEADVLIVTHYHYDHHDPDSPDIYGGKLVLIKDPNENINFSQRRRASYFLDKINNLASKISIADGNSFKFGGTLISFSKAVFHGTNPKLGFVVEVSIRSGGEVFFYTSDVEGPSVDSQVEFILAEKPNILFVDGPMTYMLGYRYSNRSLEASIENLIRILSLRCVETLVLDHHLLRDLKYRERVSKVYDVAGEFNCRVLTAAEFSGRSIEMLEAHRKDLYEKYGGWEEGSSAFSE
jgi:predicted metallo-beta-lactamase superfamily hydrolase